MKVNIPQSSTVSKELPVVQEYSEDSKIPVSEIKARLHNELLKLHKKAMDDPSSVSYGEDSSMMFDQAANNLKTELEHPEDATDDDNEYNELFNVGSDEQAAGAEQFSQPLDNMSLGFADEGMNAINDTANAAFDDFGDEGSEDITAGDINSEDPLAGMPDSDAELLGNEEAPEESPETSEGQEETPDLDNSDGGLDL